MSNDLEKNRQEKLFDAVLKIAVEESAIQELDSLPTDEELNDMFPHLLLMKRYRCSYLKKSGLHK